MVTTVNGYNSPNPLKKSFSSLAMLPKSSMTHYNEFQGVCSIREYQYNVPET